MREIDFLYKAIDILFVPMVQSNIACENYLNATIKPFNTNILSLYRSWLDNYHKLIEEGIAVDDPMVDAKLIKFLRTTKNELVNNTLNLFAKDITKDYLTYEQLLEFFQKQDEDNNISNPFEELLIYIREQEIAYTLQNQERNLEDGTMVSIKPVVLFSEDELTSLRQQNQSIKLNSDDGELAGHVTYKNDCDMLKHQVSIERMNDLFSEIVLGVHSDVE